MAIIRKIEIRRFRGIAQFEWAPSPGINCLIGPGDSCKTTVLDAIDMCLAARRNLSLSDADFHKLDVSKPIEIAITIGNLRDGLKNLDSYGLYLRGLDPNAGVIHDEPDNTKFETVLTVRLTVASDLEPNWHLYSKRAEDQGQARGLTWPDRSSISPNRLGAYADSSLTWGRSSILNKISDETVEASEALAQIARDARDAFGEKASDSLPKALDVVANTAKKLGVPSAYPVSAMLDAHSVSFSGGTISLHDADGVPLKGLGLGSKRLLVAGLQRAAAARAPIVLIDEIEHGLEPHRIIRLLHELGAKEKNPPLQVFMTSHSPVAVRELDVQQLFILRRTEGDHTASCAAAFGDVQGTIRLSPEAMLARSVLVAEGATEIGFVRGIDRRLQETGTSIMARAGALVDGRGSETFMRANAFQALGYRTAVLVDSDVDLPKGHDEFAAAGGKVFAWSPGRSLDEELFYALPDPAVGALVRLAVENKGRAVVEQQIKVESNNSVSLASCVSPFSREMRAVLATSAKKYGWLKSISLMEAAAYDVVSQHLKPADENFKKRVKRIFDWFNDGGN